MTRSCPIPLNSGKRIRTFQLVSRLARKHRITYICHRNADPGEAVEAEGRFAAWGSRRSSSIGPCPPSRALRFYARLAANLLSPLPYSVATHRSTLLDRAIRDVAAREKIDLWQAEWTPYAESLRGLGPGPPADHGPQRRVADLAALSRERDQPAEALVHRPPVAEIRASSSGGSFARPTRWWPSATRTPTLIRDQFGVSHVDVVENGVDTAYFPPRRFPRDPHQILFLGSLDWRPNLDAVDQLLDTIFPAVRAQEPSARLCLVGRNPPEALRRRVQATPGVELHANVPDVRPFLARSALMVVPLRIGGGSRLKILEAFAAGLPVVSTRIGAEGLDAENG